MKAIVMWFVILEKKTSLKKKRKLCIKRSVSKANMLLMWVLSNYYSQEEGNYMDFGKSVCL